MVFVIREDLKMSPGKIAAQTGHAAVGCYEEAQKHIQPMLDCWQELGCTKIVTICNGLDEMREIQKKATSYGLVTYIVKDAGRTEVPIGSLTVLAVGPAPIEYMNKVTGNLKLLR